MEPINDDVLGELKFDGSWTRQIELVFLGIQTEVELIVKGNDESGLILNEQREAYKQLSASILRAEEGILEYYQRVCTDYRAQFGSDADVRMPRINSKAELSRLVRFTGVICPMVFNPGEVRIGFLLECSWEPEHGLGVRIINGEVEVGTQDILT